MFGFGKGKKGKKGKKKAGKKMTREQIVAEAMANARKAKEEVGEETIQKLAEGLAKQGFKAPPMPGVSNTLPQQSEGQRAKERIKRMDKEVVADHVRSLIREDDY